MIDLRGYTHNISSSEKQIIMSSYLSPHFKYMICRDFNDFLYLDLSV